MFFVDKIILQGMEFYGYHGVLPEENELGQRFFVDLELGLDLKKAGITDDPAHTVSYAEVFEVAREIVEGKSRKLIEAVAEDIAAAVIKRFPVRQVTVKVKKPSAPVPGHFSYMAVEITRHAGDVEK